MKQVVIFIGASGSGKSTLSNLLAKEFNLKKADVVKSVLERVKKIKEKFDNFEDLKIAYQNFIKDLAHKEYDIIEIASDWPEIYLPRIVNAIRTRRSSPITVIFCYCGLKSALLRNKIRDRKVPEDVIKKQIIYNQENISEICKNINIKIISIDTEKGIDISYRILKTQIK